MSLALSKASFELMTVARDDLKRGRLRLKALSYMTTQADPRVKRKRSRKGIKSRAPLTGLFRGITYKVDRRTMSSEVGFRGLGGTAWQAKYAERSLEGYRWHYTQARRESLHKIGIHLRPTTALGRVPSRDIMGVVYDRHGKKKIALIHLLFLKRIAGERI